MQAMEWPTCTTFWVQCKQWSGSICKLEQVSCPYIYIFFGGGGGGRRDPSEPPRLFSLTQVHNAHAHNAHALMESLGTKPHFPSISSSPTLLLPPPPGPPGEFCLVHLLLCRQPAVFFQHFVECVFHFNSYQKHRGECVMPVIT